MASVLTSPFVSFFHRCLNLSFGLARRRISDRAFLSGDNCQYLEQLYNNWRENPKSVAESWEIYFIEFDSLQKNTAPKFASSVANLKVDRNLESKLKF